MNLQRLTLTVLFLAARAVAMAQPNFVVILVDDLRWDSLASTGHPFVSSPNIDRIAQEGVVFRNAFVTTPLCSPSRASFLTGRYARHHGVLTNGNYDALSHELVTFPALLQDAGYETAFIGKWHMGSDDTARPGFTYWVGLSGQGEYKNPALNINGRPVQAEGYLTDLLNAYAVDFVRTAARAGRPFLLYLSHKAVHEPFELPRRYETLYSEERIDCSPGCSDSLEGKLALTRTVSGSEPPVAGQGGLEPKRIRQQLAMLAAVDDGVGDVFRALREEGVLDQTAIVLTSDNGYFYGEHALGDKRWPYEEAIRIPLLMRYPPFVEPRSQIDELVLNIDLAPTLLDFAGVSTSTPVDGRSLLPLLTEEDVSWRGSFLAEYFEEAPFPRIPSWEAIRTTQFKYVRYPALGEPYDELYDLATDPYELQNRIDDPSLSETLKELRESLASIGAP
jgi:arylsulfatase A-like enzyme